MRTAVIFVFVLVTASPSHASKSCMTMAEARTQFATSHLYWHGPNHCWDTTAPQHRIISRVKPKERQQAREAQEENQADSASPAVASQDDATVPAKREPKWRNAMSEMLPVDAPSVASAAPQLAAIATSGMTWLDRWVDVAQIAPPAFLRRGTEAATVDIVTTAGQKADPMVTPMRLILVFLSIVVVLALIELLFRNTIHERLD
jgi:hypothetical protein